MFISQNVLNALNRVMGQHPFLRLMGQQMGQQMGQLNEL